VLRSFVDEPDRRAQWSAVVGLLGALNVPIVYMSVKWWRTLHQIQSSPRTIDSSYTWSLRANAIALLVVLIYFIWHRYATSRLAARVDAVADAAALRGSEVAVHA
jgi:heme exporter protein C